LNVLVWLYKVTGDLGIAIISLTVGLRLVLTPLIIPGLKVSKKMQELAPELAKLKSLHKDDKQALALAQSELYKQNNINPASGCLPQIAQIVILIALFNAFNLLLRTAPGDLGKTLTKHLYVQNKVAENFVIDTKFLKTVDLVKPDMHKFDFLPIPLPGLLLILSSLVQFLSSKMMMPIVDAASKKAKETAGDTDDALMATQEQMIYMMPLMTILFGAQFPSGLVLYWFVFSFVAIIQQYFITGWGGLEPWLNRLGLIKSPLT
jgi:YidC/Oxa1 family membrane protein insertase